MTAKRLIEILSTIPSDTEVCSVDESGDTVPITEVRWQKSHTDKTRVAVLDNWDCINWPHEKDNVIGIEMEAKGKANV